MSERTPPRVSGVRVLRAMQRDILGTLARAQRDHGDVILLEPGPPGLRSRLYACFHPDDVRHMLATESGRYRKDNAFYRELRWALGDGLLTSQDDEYKRQRRFVQPLFTRRRIALYAAAMADEAESLAPRWRTAVQEGSPIDMHAEMLRITLRVVARILFGADVERAVSVIAGTFPTLGEYARLRSYNPYPPPRSWPLPSNRRARRARAAVRSVCDQMIAERRSQPPRDDDLLSLLVSARDGDDGLDDDEVRDQVLIFLLAGHDTTASALSFTLHLLGRHRDVQERVRAEIRALTGSRAPRAEDVEQLTYTNMVIQEAMRLYPPAWGTGRRLVGADELRGYALPDGAEILVCAWITHRHPEFWSSPETFDPERFAPEAEAARPRHAYFPFGIGPRTCIGQHFALLEAAILLAVILRDHDVTSLSESLPVSPQITLHPAIPVRCVLTPRAPRNPRTPGSTPDRGPATQARPCPVATPAQGTTPA